MTAAATPTPASVPEPAKPGRHRATRTRRLPSLPALPHRGADKPAKPAKPAKPQVRPAHTEQTVRATAKVTPTGKALFSVAQDGQTSQNVTLGVAGKVATFAVTTGEAVQDAFPGDWWIQLFETTEQRRRRVNATAVAQTLILAGQLAAKIVNKR